jgi:Bacterial SH3 domain
MANVDVTEGRRERLAERMLDPPAEPLAPPLAPTATPAARNSPHRQPFGSVRPEEHLFQYSERADLPEIRTSFLSRRPVIAGTAFVVALGIGALGYFLLGSAGEQTRTPQTAEPPATTVQNSPETLVEAPSSTPGPPAAVPPSVTAEASPEVVPDTPIENTVTPQPTATSENLEYVFLQRPGVNIRSTPSANGPVLGTLPKGTRFTALSREGDWIQIESSRLKGWINSQFLGPNKPR